MRFIRKSLVGLFSFGVIFSFQIAWAQTSSDSSALSGLQVQSQQTTCTNLKTKYENYKAKVGSLCRQMGSENDVPNLSTDQCSNDIATCSQTFQEWTKDIREQLNTELYNGKLPDTPDQIPAPGSKDYCPSVDDTDSDVTTSSSLKPGCMQLKGQEKINALSHYLNDDSSTIAKDQENFSKTEEKLLDSANKCNDNRTRLQEQLQSRETDRASANQEELVEIAGDDSNLQSEVNALQAKMDEASQTEKELLNVQYANALSIYNAKLQAALTECHSSLVDQGKKNQLTWSSIGENITASQSGLTNYKCQQDFTYQTKAAAAYQDLVVARLTLLSKMQEQDLVIKNIQKDIVAKKKNYSVRDQGIVTKYAKRIADDTNAINSMTQQLTSLESSCSAQAALQGSNAKNAAGSALEASLDRRTSACQLQYLETKTGLVPTGKETDNSKEVEKIHDILNDPQTDPCVDVCKAYCSPDSTQNGDPSTTPVPQTTSGKQKGKSGGKAKR